MVASVLSETKITTAKDLARLRQRLTGCELIVMTDISAGTVLAWDGALKFPQEHLDDICGQARGVFEIGGGYVADWAALSRPTGLGLFLRLPQEPVEVLCAVLPLGVDVQAALRQLRAALDAGAPQQEG